MKTIITIITFILFFAGSQICFSKPEGSAEGPNQVNMSAFLDTGKVRDLYFQEKFEKVESLLQKYLESNVEETYTPYKLTAFRFMAATLGQDESNLENSRIYMWSMLEIDSTSHLSNLNLPETTQNLFLKIKQGYIQGNQDVLTDDIEVVLGLREKREKRRWLWYGLGGAGVAATLGTVFLLLPQTQQTQLEAKL